MRRSYIDKVIKDYYSKISKIYEYSLYEDRPECMVEEQKIIEKFLNYLVGDKILDIGCGTGYWLAKVEGKKKIKYGLDYCKEMIKEAQTKKIKLLIGDIRELPIKDNSIDSIICFFVLQHMTSHKKLKKAVEELYRICKFGGNILTAENIFNSSGEIINKCKLEVESWPKDYGMSPIKIYRRLTNTKELEKIFSKLGMKVLDFESKNNVFIYALKKCQN